MVDLPSGTVTFVFSDIEDSTALLKRTGDADYATLLAVHRRLVRDIFSAHDGHEIDTQGDAFFYSFIRARQAVAAAVEVQRAHVKASWPGDLAVRVRLGLHTGEPAVGDEGYTGMDVVRAARIAALATGGQILLSDTTRAIAANVLPDGVRLHALGDRQLKGVDRPEPRWALVLDEVAADPEPPPQPAAAEADEAAGRSMPFRDLVERATASIQSSVLAELERSLPGGRPEAPPPRSVTREIDRLHRLRERGALTEEQYNRLVEKLVAGDGAGS